MNKTLFSCVASDPIQWKCHEVCLPGNNEVCLLGIQIRVQPCTCLSFILYMYLLIAVSNQRY